MIIANMATYPGRKDIILDSVKRLLPQVDKLNLCLNEFTDIPLELKDLDKLNPFIPNKDYKDMGKFLHNYNDNDYVLLVDDDIIYPDDYVETLVSYYNKFSDLNCIVGCHGIIYSDIFDGNALSRKVFSFTKRLDRNRVVNQLGTGTVLLKGSQMPSIEYMLGSEKFVDVRFSKYLYEKKIHLICIERNDNWMKEKTVTNSIFNEFTKKWPLQPIKEVQKIAGYSKLDFNAVLSIEKT